MISPTASFVTSRARGIGREIPRGRTIVPTSGANDSFLAADTQSNALVNESADPGGAVLIDLAGAKPSNAESFQWVNLMRGDTMLMSLVNHCYLATKLNEPDQVTATALGPTPARKGCECFKWKAVE